MSSTPTILLWGLPTDSPLTAVDDALRHAGHDPIFLDQNAILETEVELFSGATLKGHIHLPGRTLDLASVSAFYLRPSDSHNLPAIAAAGAGSDAFRHALAVDDILCSWADLTPALVLNRPSAMASNNSKPHQSAWIEALGFRVPETLLTTDPALALDFWNHHGQVIYKSISGIRSIVSRLQPHHLQRLDDISACPTQFQQYIAGSEYRVHVVGREVFAHAILSDATDYRYADSPFEARACELPAEIASRCVRVSQAMDLTLAGLDLRLTPQGEWFCFEVNPSPAFSCFQEPSNQTIAASVARLLCSAPPPVREVEQKDQRCAPAEEPLLQML